MKTVLLTGATGFIGRHCLPLLVSRDYEVHAVSSKTVDKNSPSIHWHRVNLLKTGHARDLMEEVRPTHLLHFAWFTLPGKYWSSLENIHWVKASMELLLAFVRNGGQRAVTAGTCAEYDWKYGYCSEQTTSLSPSTLYGACKHSLQVMSEALMAQAGATAAWGRIFFIYGPHEYPSRLVSSVIQSLLSGKPACCSHANHIRDFLYVKDVADAFVSLLECKVPGPVNIASGQPVILKDLVCKIARKLNREDLITLDNLATSPDDPRLLLADVSRLNNEVNWSPKYTLDAGLDQTIEWWKSHLTRTTSDSE